MSDSVLERQNNMQEKKCKNCGQLNSISAASCVICGNDLTISNNYEIIGKKTPISGTGISGEVKRIWPFGLSKFISVLLVAGLFALAAWTFFSFNKISFVPWIQDITKDTPLVEVLDPIIKGDESAEQDNLSELADKEEKEKNKKKKSNSKDYILIDSNKKYISQKKIRKLSTKELAIARNEIYARKGRKFTTKKWKNYFKKKKWYKPKYGAKYFDKHEKKILNKYERENIKRIKKIEKKRK